MNLERAYRLARAKMDERGLQKWDVMFDRSKTRFGCCWHYKKLITLSEDLVVLNSEEEVLNTILHEMAHALVSHRHGHDKVWRQKAIELGCNGKRCYDGSVIQPPTQYQATCDGCGYIYHRHRMGADRKYFCTLCNRKGNRAYLKFISGANQARA